MKTFKLLFSLLVACFVGQSMAANITIYYAPTCPHCHHARDFIKSELIYVYNDLSVTEVNVMEQDNRQDFFDTIKKCEYKSGGVPVMVIGGKCFQGYSDKMQDSIRSAIEADYTDAQKKSASANKVEFDKNKTSFVNAHSDRKNAIVEKDSKKKIK